MFACEIIDEMVHTHGTAEGWAGECGVSAVFAFFVSIAARQQNDLLKLCLYSTYYDPVVLRSQWLSAPAEDTHP